MNQSWQKFKYIFFDFLAAGIAWACFFYYRKIYIEQYSWENPLELIDQRFYLGMALVPVFWIFLYVFSGYYNNIFTRSRLSDLGDTLKTTFFGTIILFFALLLDDTVQSHTNYYKSLAVLFSLHFSFTYLPRVILTTITNHKIHRGIIGFNTIIVGGNGKALEVYEEIKTQKKNNGNILVGFLSVLKDVELSLLGHLPHLGDSSQLIPVIHKYKIEEVIIALDTNEQEKISRILNHLEGLKVTIKVIPSMYDILTGKVRMTTIFGTPLIRITHNLLPYWQELLKQVMDYSVSVLALLITLPLGIGLAIAIKITSKGPVIYSHERLGRYGKPFNIYKFRSMYTDSEKTGPQLSSDNDPRITRVGKFMRKMRLDELPNFINVLKGEMSLVGPRPERRYYIEQIIKIAPHYIHLQKVKPGITSWGQVKFGYASTVEEMVKRLKYDILYIENMSLYIDLKILIYTVLTIVRREGK